MCLPGRVLLEQMACYLATTAGFSAGLSLVWYPSTADRIVVGAHSAAIWTRCTRPQGSLLSRKGAVWCLDLPPVLHVPPWR